MNLPVVVTSAAGKQTLLVSEISPGVPQPVPALVLSGTLGSGKSTVINSMLEEGVLSPDLRITLLENDIGKANQDYARIRLPDTQKIPLTSGCICCRSLGHMGAEILRIQNLPEAARPDLILVETTGIAHPDLIKKELQRLSVAALIVVTVDVAHFEDNVQLGLVDRGIASADRIVLTWWDGIVTPDRLDDPAITSVLGHIDRVELEAIALGVKKQTAPRIFYRAAEGQRPAEFIATPETLDLVPSVISDAIPSEATFAAEHAALKARTLHFREGVSVSDLLNALSPFMEEGGRILRLKSTGIDIVQNELRDNHIESRLEGAVNIVTSPAFDLALVEHLAEVKGVEIPTSAEERSLAAAARRLQELTDRHPVNPVHERGIQLDYHEDEGFDYADRAGIDPELRNAFYDKAVTVRAVALNAICSEDWQEHSELPYYRWRMGSQGVWWIENRPEDLERNNALELFRNASPANLYFEGLLGLREPGQVEELKNASIPWLGKMVNALVQESGDSAMAVMTAFTAFRNCLNIDRTGTWQAHWDAIVSMLHQAQRL